MKSLKIEMVHDLVCSWCPIGYAKLQQALRNLEIAADMRFLPLELNPGMPEEGETIACYFKRQQGWNSATLHDYQKTLVKTALNAGIIIDFSKRTHYYNTRKAHKLIHWAEQFNKQTTIHAGLIEAYFTQGLNIRNTGVLLDIAEQAGMDRISTQHALSSTHLAQALEKKTERQKTFKLPNIPAFIFNNGTVVSGSNSVETFEKTLSNFINGLYLNNKIAI